MKSSNERRQASEDRKRANGFYKPNVWFHETWKGTEALEKLKELVKKPRVKE